MKKADIVILTPLKVEYQAIFPYLKNIELEKVGNLLYELGEYQGKYFTYKIAIRQIGASNIVAALATEKAVNYFHPNCIILFGIAGGVKDVKIGDIVVGKKSYFYEAGKETPNGFMSRPEVFDYDRDLLEFIQYFERKDTWHQSLNYKKKPKVYFGAVAAGNKVISTIDGVVYNAIQSHFNDSLCVEMEAAGFGEAMTSYRAIRTLDIRGISDLLKDKTKTDRKGKQEVAVRNAAAFLFGFLNELKFSDYKLNIMDEKQLAEAIQHQIQQYASNNQLSLPQQQLLSKVEQIAPKALATLQAEINDSDIQTFFRVSLAQQLKNQQDLFAELTQLLHQIGSKLGDKSSMKNVISNSTIHANNVSVGDQTTTIGQQVNNYGKVGKQVNVDRMDGDITI